MTNKNELKSFHDLLLEGVPVGDLVTTVEKKGFIRIDEYGRYRRISPLSRIEHEISEGILDPLLASEDKQEAAVAKDYLRQVYQLLNENSLSYSDGCEQMIFDEEDGQLLALRFDFHILISPKNGYIHLGREILG